VDESTSCHKQAISTLRSGEVVENHMEERKEEQIEVPQDLHQEKGKEVSTELLHIHLLFPRCHMNLEPLFQFMIPYRMRNYLRILRGIYLDM
jgi:hypothetical protein